MYLDLVSARVQVKILQYRHTHNQTIYLSTTSSSFYKGGLKSARLAPEYLEFMLAYRSK